VTAPVTRVEYVVREVDGFVHYPFRATVAEAQADVRRVLRYISARKGLHTLPIEIIERTTTITERVLAPEEEG
jgi:hypothetical protein